MSYPVSIISSSNKGTWVHKLDLGSIEARSRAKDEFRSGGFKLFWTAYQSYLAGWGYTLYDVLDKDYRAIAPPSLCPPSSHPYAFVAYNPEDRLNDHLAMVTSGFPLEAAKFLTCHFQSLLLYAQDKDN